MRIAVMHPVLIQEMRGGVAHRPEVINLTRRGVGLMELCWIENRDER